MFIGGAPLHLAIREGAGGWVLINLKAKNLNLTAGNIYS
jgi:hypothetical protein